MASKIKGLTVVIDGDVTSLSKAMKEAKSEATMLKRHLKSATELLNMDPSGMENITKKQELLNDALTQCANHLGMLKTAEAQYYASTTAHTEAEQRQFMKLQQEITQTELKFERLKEEAVEFGLSASAATLSLKGELGTIGEELDKAGDKLMPLSAATALLGYGAVDAAAKFESSFAGVRKTLDATETEFNQLAKASREMALTKPIDVNDINYAMELGAQLGIAAENLDLFASVISDLTVAAPSLELEDAALKLAQFANIANISHEDFDKLGSVIVALGNNSATTEYKIMSMAMRIAGSGSNIGLSAENVLALATALASVGIEAEMGGNAISTIMNRIDKDVALGTDTLQVWADTAGMSAEAFAAAWDDPDAVMGAMLAVIEGMATYRDEGGNLNTLLKDMEISYMRQIDTMQRLSRTGDVVNEMITIANGAWDQNTALVIEAERRYETAESQAQILKNTVNELALVMGNEMLPTVKEIIGATSDLVLDFSEMDYETKQNIIRMGLLAAAAAPAAKALGFVSTNMSKFIGFLASAKTNLVKYTTGLDGATKAERALGAANERAALKTSMAEKAMNLLQGAAISLAIAGIGLLISEISKAIEHEKNMEKATDGLRDAVDEMYSSAIDGEASVLELGDAAKKAAPSLEELKVIVSETAKEQAKLAESIRESFDQAGIAVGMLEGYYDVIDRLYGRTDLTAREQAELSNAIEVVNQKCGTSYKVVQDETGAFVAMGDGAEYAKDEILKLIEAQQLQIQLTAYQDAHEDAYAQQKEAAEAAAAAYQTYLEKKKAYEEAAALPGRTVSGKWLAEYKNEMDSAWEDFNELSGYSIAAAEAVDQLYDSTVLVQKAMNDGAGSISFTASSCHELMAMLEQTGKNALDFVSKMEDAGVSAEDFAGLTEEQMMNLASAFDGTFASIEGLLSEYGVGFDEAKAKAADSVNIIRAEVEKLNPDNFDAYEWGEGIIGDLARGIKKASDTALASAIYVAKETISNGLNQTETQEPSATEDASYVESLSSVGGSGYVPSFLANPSASQTVTTNETKVSIYIDGARINDDPAIEGRFYDLMLDLKRISDMEGGE